MEIKTFKRNSKWLLAAMLAVTMIHGVFYSAAGGEHNIAQIFVAVLAAGYFFSLQRKKVFTYVEMDRSGNRGGGLLAIGLSFASGLYLTVSGMHPVIVIPLAALFFAGAAVLSFLLTIYEKLNMPSQADMEPQNEQEMILANDALLGVQRGRRTDLLFIDRGNGQESLPVTTQLTYATLRDPFVKVIDDRYETSGTLFCSMDQYKLLKQRAEESTDVAEEA